MRRCITEGVRRCVAEGVIGYENMKRTEETFIKIESYHTEQLQLSSSYTP